MNIDPILATCPILYVAAALGILMTIYVFVCVLASIRKRYMCWKHMRDDFMARPMDERIRIIETYRETSANRRFDYDGLPIEYATFFRSTRTWKSDAIAELIEWNSRALLKGLPASTE
jgi:hypothetical protein